MFGRPNVAIEEKYFQDWYQYTKVAADIGKMLLLTAKIEQYNIARECYEKEQKFHAIQEVGANCEDWANSKHDAQIRETHL